VTVCVFAADHGVVDEGVTCWPATVTAQMVGNIAAGGAAVNVLARQAGADLRVVDVGVATPLPAGAAGVLRRTVAPGTANLARRPAMTRPQTEAALDVGAEVAETAVADGARLLAIGEMGIGNTTAAAALIGGLTARSAAAVTGRGSGVDDERLARKTAVVAGALERSRGAAPRELLADVGGLEIAAMAGAMVAGAASRVPVLVDGVISASAALMAVAIVPAVSGYLIAGHRSAEPGATVALDHLGLTPILQLDLRLGEGTGAVLAVPVVQAAARLLREMATFDDAHVSHA
jgi:nicotinate-nucleotide--dimethylbenzimidazole phosphoribosyltransferase